MRSGRSSTTSTYIEVTLKKSRIRRRRGIPFYANLERELDKSKIKPKRLCTKICRYEGASS